MDEEKTVWSYVTDIGTCGDLEIKDPTVMEVLKESDEEENEELAKIKESIMG